MGSESIELLPQGIDKVSALSPVLDSLDREIAFYRHRAGQIYFFGLLAEVAIIIGKEEIELSGLPSWVNPAVSTFFFIAVALVGTILGSEYRRRIRFLKTRRDMFLRSFLNRLTFPHLKQETISEIQVLYFVLGSMSSMGIFISWLKEWPLEWLIHLFIGLATIFIAIGSYYAYRCLTAKPMTDETAKDDPTRSRERPNISNSHSYF